MSLIAKGREQIMNKAFVDRPALSSSRQTFPNGTKKTFPLFQEFDGRKKGE